MPTRGPDRSAPGLEEASLLIGDIYDTSVDATLWPAVLEKICSFVGGAAAVLMSESGVSEKGKIYCAAKTDSNWIDAYFQTYIHLNPLRVPALLHANVDDVFSVYSFMSHEEFQSTRFYKEWVQPQQYFDAISAMIEKTASSLSVLVVTRYEREGPFDEEAHRRMRLLAPHLRRAVTIGRLIDLKSLEASDFASTLDGIAAGIFLVDARGRIVHANASGQSLLEQKIVLRQVNGAIVAVDPDAGVALREALAAATGGDAEVGVKGIAIALSAGGLDRQVANILPLTSGARRRAGAAHGAAAAIFVRKADLEMPSALETIAQTYELTSRELSVLLGIVEIGGVPEVASVLGLSETTVKSYLKSVFQKTGARRQADLVKLVAGLAHASSKLRSEDAP
jgi:DNA-binding CsgD family transcriptional regulator/PAS domain-containing protein